MFRKLKEINKNSKGFTIIEVLIVLAIAGLILLIVFLAVPALQRNSRNTSRRSDVAHLAGLINEYAANHGGVLPTTIDAAGMDIVNERWAVMTAPVTADIISTNTFPALLDTTHMKIVKTFVCDTSANTLSAGSARSFSITFRVETGGADVQSCVTG